MERNWRRIVSIVAVAVLAQVTLPAAQAQSTPSSSLTIPMFAKVSGDGTGVDFAWWAVRGATGYELLRTSDPQQPAIVIGSISPKTLGYRDTQPGVGPQYYQLAALGADGSRVPGAWVQYQAPIIQSATATGTSVLISWTGVSNAPNGYEIWRTASPQQSAARVGTVPSGTVTFHDKQPPAGTCYYQVIAIESGARAASSFFAYPPLAGTGQMHALLPSNTHGNNSGSGGGSTSGESTNSSSRSGSQANNASSQNGPIWFQCFSTNVTVYAGGPNARLEVQCNAPYQTTISYFTFPTGGANAADADRMLSIAQGHVLNRFYYHDQNVNPAAGHSIDVLPPVSELWILFDPNDLNGTSYGCLNRDCRNIIALRLVPLDLGGSFHYHDGTSN